MTEFHDLPPGCTFVSASAGGCYRFRYEADWIINVFELSDGSIVYTAAYEGQDWRLKGWCFDSDWDDTERSDARAAVLAAIGRIEGMRRRTDQRD
jgi:hypothetical protein